MDTSSAVPDVSIVIPVYNGSTLLEKHLIPLLGWVNRQSYTTEIILVDDGSKDRDATASFALRHRMAFHGLQTNKGKGAALRIGFRAARGRIQLFTDADIPFDHEDIGSLVTLLQMDPHRLVIGDRTHPSSQYFERTGLLRKWGSRTVSFLVKHLLLLDVRDTQCGLKGMGHEVAGLLFGNSHIDRFAIDLELILLARLQDIPVLKFPVSLRYNDQSSVHVTRDGSRLLLDMYRIRTMHRKRKYDQTHGR